MSLHAHSIHVEELVSLPKPRGENAKANQPLSAHRQATCSVIMIREVRLGACARRSHTREFNAHPGGCHQWGAMTGCPQLRVDESVVAKPIPAILCCPDWDDAKGVKATAEVTMWCTDEYRALRQAPLRQCASPPCSTSSTAARVDRTRTPPSPSPTAMIARLLLEGDGKNQQSQPASVPPDSGHLSCAG
jgi:hypothetical protein